MREIIDAGDTNLWRSVPSLSTDKLCLHRLFHTLHSLNYLLFDQCLYRKQFLWIVYSEK